MWKWIKRWNSLNCSIICSYHKPKKRKGHLTWVKEYTSKCRRSSVPQRAESGFVISSDTFVSLEHLLLLWRMHRDVRQFLAVSLAVIWMVISLDGTCIWYARKSNYSQMACCWWLVLLNQTIKSLNSRRPTSNSLATLLAWPKWSISVAQSEWLTCTLKTT